MLYVIVQTNTPKQCKIYKISIDDPERKELNELKMSLKNILNEHWINMPKKAYEMDITPDHVFEAIIEKDKTTELLKTFVDKIINFEEFEDFQKIKNNNDLKLKAVIFWHNDYICIQKDKVLSHLHSSSKFKILFGKNSKFKIVKDLSIITIEEYYHGVIKINRCENNKDIKNYSIYFRYPQNIVMYNILNIPGHNKYKYDTKEKVEKAIKLEKIDLKNLVDLDTLDNIVVDRTTKVPLNFLLNLNKEQLKLIINYLDSHHKDKPYITKTKQGTNLLAFPSDKKKFKQLTKIIQDKIYKWEITK